MDADELVARYILREYRREKTNSYGGTPHLAECPEATVEHPQAEDGEYGCETGCEYVRMTATIRCPHGESSNYEYGEFGQLAYIIEDLEREQA